LRWFRGGFAAPKPPQNELKQMLQSGLEAGQSNNSRQKN